MTPRTALSDFQIPRVSGATRYRVTGEKPATGRSGTAQVTARALVDKEGNTLLEITTGALDQTSTPPGTLTKAQVKMLDPNDLAVTLATANYLDLTSGYFSRTLGGFGADYPLQVQANVRGIDGNRTDVVTTIERVKLRPDLAVTLGALASVLPRVPTQIAATVSELNGDIGATGDCSLFVNGTQVDQAPGIWVDAGDAVSCAFMYAFPAVGDHAVEVQIGDVTPGDWDTANNSAQAMITVVDPAVRPTYYHVSAAHYVYTYDRYANGSWRSLLDPSTVGYWERTFEDTHRQIQEQRQISVQGWGEPFIQFPLQSIQASFWNDGQLMQDGAIAGPVDPNSSYIEDGSQWGYPDYYSEQLCRSDFFDGQAAGRVYWNVCTYRETYDGGATWYRQSQVSAQHYAGTVTYWSAGWNQTLFRGSDGTLACQPSSCYSWNNTATTTVGSSPYLTLGSQVRGAFSLVTADGINVAVDLTVPLSPFISQASIPYGCRDFTDWNFYAAAHYCEQYSYQQVGKSGFVYQY